MYIYFEVIKSKQKKNDFRLMLETKKMWQYKCSPSIEYSLIDKIGKLIISTIKYISESFHTQVQLIKKRY